MSLPFRRQPSSSLQPVLEQREGPTSPYLNSKARLKKRQLNTSICTSRRARFPRKSRWKS